VTWLNAAAETKAPYDLTVTQRGAEAHRGGSSTTFIEVKTSRYRDRNVFELSYCEWEFISREPPVRYSIYRVSGAGEAGGSTITVIEDVLQAVKDGSVRLCMAI